MNTRRKITIALLWTIIIIILGTLGYHFLEGWSLFDSFYMTMITITTTGYGEIHAMSVKGRLISIVLMLFGISIFIYVISILPELFWEELFHKGVEGKVKKMRNHTIICGFGKLAQELVCKLDKKKLVVIDESPIQVERARELGINAIMGDATQEETLRRAGVERAKAVIATLDSDAKNFVVTMIAKSLNPSVFVIATARTQKPTSSFWKASRADAFISPYVEAADKVSHLLKKPSTVQFIEVLSSKEEEIMIESIEVRSSKLTGKSLGELNIRRQFGINIVLIQRGEHFIIPDANYRFQIGDKVFALGRHEQLESFEKLLTEV